MQRQRTCVEHTHCELNQNKINYIQVPTNSNRKYILISFTSTRQCATASAAASAKYNGMAWWMRMNVVYKGTYLKTCTQCCSSFAILFIYFVHTINWPLHSIWLGMHIQTYSLADLYLVATCFATF